MFVAEAVHLIEFVNDIDVVCEIETALAEMAANFGFETTDSSSMVGNRTELGFGRH